MRVTDTVVWSNIKLPNLCKGNVKAMFYIAQYPVLSTVQSALHFTSLTDLFTQTLSRLIWEASSHMLQIMREGCSYTYPPLSIARYSFIQLSELEQCRVKKLAQGFNTAAQDSNPGSRSRVSEALPLNHGALRTLCTSFLSLKLYFTVAVRSQMRQLIHNTMLVTQSVLYSSSEVSNVAVHP